ncbi:hypothetical protein AC1031_019511 [Aphanomyces cochlioides]|nr:hypothetical protein AC1031_019511 [Aphanomyces cochlioides]
MDIMLEYWSEKRGIQRESLLSTDDDQPPLKQSLSDDMNKPTKRVSSEELDSGRNAKKQKSTAVALASGFECHQGWVSITWSGSGDTCPSYTHCSRRVCVSERCAQSY